MPSAKRRQRDPYLINSLKALKEGEIRIINHPHVSGIANSISRSMKKHGYRLATRATIGGTEVRKVRVFSNERKADDFVAPPMPPLKLRTEEEAYGIRDLFKPAPVLVPTPEPTPQVKADISNIVLTPNDIKELIALNELQAQFLDRLLKR